MPGTAVTTFRAAPGTWCCGDWAPECHHGPGKGLRVDLAVKGPMQLEASISVIYVPAPPRGSGQRLRDAELHEQPQLTGWRWTSWTSEAKPMRKQLALGLGRALMGAAGQTGAGTGGVTARVPA